MIKYIRGTRCIVSRQNTYHWRSFCRKRCLKHITCIWIVFFCSSLKERVSILHFIFSNNGAFCILHLRYESSSTRVSCWNVFWRSLFICSDVLRVMWGMKGKWPKSRASWRNDRRKYGGTCNYGSRFHCRLLSCCSGFKCKLHCLVICWNMNERQ